MKIAYSRLFCPLLVLLGFACSCTNGGPVPAAEPKAPAVGTNAAPSTGAPGARLPAGEVVATWSGQTLTYADLTRVAEKRFAQLKKKHLQELFQAEREELRSMAIKKLVEEAAKKKGQNSKQYLDAIANSVQVSDAELSAFYEKNVKPRGEDFASTKDKIRNYLLQEKRQTAIGKEFARLSEVAGLKVTLSPPEGIRATFDLSTAARKGKKDAKIQIVEFSDFECPYCARALPGIEALQKEFGDDLAVYFMNFPLSFHKAAMPAAIAAKCAGRQNKFWEMHDQLFQNQQQLQPDQLLAHAKSLKLDLANFESCQKDPAILAEIRSEMKVGEQAGVGGTPAFFVNGFEHRGIPSVDDVRGYVAN